VPIPCAACAKPVHEHAVVCPHCGGATGVAADPRLTAEERAAAVELARVEADTHVPPPSYVYTTGGSYTYDPEVALLEGVGVAAVAIGAVVKSAVEAVVDERAERASRPELPRAYARERTAPPVIPDPSKEPEPPPPHSDKPRFLK
jgi:hypothetical protein